MSVDPPRKLQYRGFCGIGIVNGKHPQNLGTLIRSANCLGADWVFAIGCRYDGQRSAVGHDGHLPVFSFETDEHFLAALPDNAELVGIELDDERSYQLPEFTHPERGVYVLGAEDTGLTDGLTGACDRVTEIPSSYCLNQAVSGSIVLYDRLAAIGSDSE